MAEWQSGRVLVLQVQSRGFDPMSALTNYFFYLRRRPNVLQRACFGSSPCGFCGTIGWHCGHCSAAYVMFKSISPSISGSRYPKKILTRCPVRWSRWTSTQLRLGYAGRSLLGFGPRVARVLNYASCTLVRDTEGYLAAPSLRDYLIFGLETTSILSYQNCPVSYFAIWAPICLIMIRER